MVFVDQHTNEPIFNVFVEWEMGEEKAKAITDWEGAVYFTKVDTPFALQAFHLNYHSISDTLYSWASPIYMQPLKHNFEEVVVTGQFQPESASRSVYQVRVLDQSAIQSYNPRDLSDVFFYQLNFRPSHDVRLGKTSFSFQGISGNNLLVLLDGVPINGRTSDDFDFGQIPIHQIERIEIVEGPMAVMFGSNAMAGVVNLITKNGKSEEFLISARSHHESVGSQIGWQSGLHNFALNGHYNFEEKPFRIGAGLSRNVFHGHRGGQNQRAMLWKPKKQWMGNLELNWHPSGWKFSLRSDYLSELIQAPGEPIGLVRPIALDDSYKTQRLFHHFQMSRFLPEFGKVESNVSVTDYRRNKQQMAVNLNTGSSQLSTAEGAQDQTSLFGVQNRTILSYLKGTDFSALAAYDFYHERIAGGRLVDEKSQSLYEMAIFGSMEYSFSNIFKIRSGLRYIYNSKHQSPLIPSINLKISELAGFDLRMAYARGYRAPSLREMYFEFFDSNHRIIGNENLMAERGHHLSLNMAYREVKTMGGSLVGSVNLFYNSISDQITYGRSIQNPQNTTLINQRKFQSLGFRMELEWGNETFVVRPSFGYTGAKNILNEDAEDLGYLFTPEAGAAVNFRPVDKKWSIGLNYKFYGQQAVYGVDLEDEEQNPELSKIDSFHWLDMSASTWVTPEMSISAGIRNVMDVKDINSSAALGSIHSNGNKEFISYGRSLFLTLNYSFK